MSITDVRTGDAPAAVIDSRAVTSSSVEQPRDLQRTFQLVLATVWLLDAVLQLQPFMFTRGSNGFSAMLHNVAAGNPGWVAHSITWNASNVNHNPILGNSIFAFAQFLIGFGIVWKRSLKPALALSIVWSLGVWWFGEGLGNILHGGATPFGGGPGAVLFYAVLAVLLWPCEGSDRPFVAARSVGVTAAKVIWVLVWGLLALLAVVGSGRSPEALHDLVTAYTGQPGWLAHIDRATASMFLHRRRGGRNPARCGLCGRGRRGLPSSTIHQGHTGPRDRDFRLRLGRHRELRRDPGRRGHRPQFRTTCHHPGVDLLAFGPGSKCRHGRAVELDSRLGGTRSSDDAHPFLAVLLLRPGHAGSGRIRHRASHRVGRHPLDRRLGRRRRPHIHGSVHGGHVHCRLGLRPEGDLGTHLCGASRLVPRAERAIGDHVRHPPHPLSDPRSNELRHALDVPVPRRRWFGSHIDVDGVLVECENRSRAQLAARMRVPRIRCLHAGLTDQGCLPSRQALADLRTDAGPAAGRSKVEAGLLKHWPLAARLG